MSANTATKNRSNCRRNWTQEVKGVLAQVFVDHSEEELTLEDIYRHALAGNKIPREWVDGIHEKAIKREFGRLLRSARLVTSDGHDVRQYQSYVRFIQSADGEEQQLHFWKDIRHMSRSEMMVAVKERVRHVQDAADSIRCDVTYWNSNVRRPGESRIQMRLEI